MDKENKLVAQLRTVSGSSSSRRLRRAGHLPGKINCEDGTCLLIQLNRHSFEMMMRHHSSEHLLFDLEVDKDKSRKVLLKEVQHNPVNDAVMHVDFLQISMTKKMRVNIPVILVGEPVGVSQEGGVLEQLLRELDVECLPADLVETIEIDVAAMKLHETLLVEKLTIDPNLTILTDKKLAVAGVMEPRQEEEATPEAAAAAGTGAAEPEVIAKEKKDGAEEAEAGEGEKKEESGKKEPAGKKPEAAAGKKPERKAGK
jgi:large subunit ribosomal protein L25